MQNRVKQDYHERQVTLILAILLFSESRYVNMQSVPKDVKKRNGKTVEKRKLFPKANQYPSSLMTAMPQMISQSTYLPANLPICLHS